MAATELASRMICSIAAFQAGAGAIPGSAFDFPDSLGGECLKIIIECFWRSYHMYTVDFVDPRAASAMRFSARLDQYLRMNQENEYCCQLVLRRTQRSTMAPSKRSSVSETVGL